MAGARTGEALADGAADGRGAAGGERAGVDARSAEGDSDAEQGDADGFCVDADGQDVAAEACAARQAWISARRKTLYLNRERAF